MVSINLICKLIRRKMNLEENGNVRLLGIQAKKDEESDNEGI